MTASEPLCVSLPNNACRELATIVTCTMHGLRHAPGSNHVCVSFLVMFTFSFVICKYNLHSSDGTSHLPAVTVRKGKHYSANLYERTQIIIEFLILSPIVPFLFQQIVSAQPHCSVPFPADCIRPLPHRPVPFKRIVSAPCPIVPFPFQRIVSAPCLLNQSMGILNPRTCLAPTSQ